MKLMMKPIRLNVCTLHLPRAIWEIVTPKRSKRQWPKWKKAIKAELDTLNQMGTWELTDAPEDRKPVTRVDRLATRLGTLALREVLTKRHNILKARLGVGTRDEKTKSQLDELWIHKTNAVIA